MEQLLLYHLRVKCFSDKLPCSMSLLMKNRNCFLFMFSSAREKQAAKPEIQAKPQSYVVLPSSSPYYSPDLCVFQLPRVQLSLAVSCVCHSSLLCGSGITSYKDWYLSAFRITEVRHWDVQGDECLRHFEGFLPFLFSLGRLRIKVLKPCLVSVAGRESCIY